MKLRQRIDKLIASSLGTGGDPDYFPHIERTVDGAIRLKLEFNAETAQGREQVPRIRATSDFELLVMLGYSGDEEGKARFSWKEQNWIALLCGNLGVNANGGEYGGPPRNKPFVEGAPVYFPVYVKMYDDDFRRNPDKAASCNYDISKPADTLIREWWDSEPAARFAFLREQWLSANAEWLKDRRTRFDAGIELASLLGCEVSQLPHSMTREEWEEVLALCPVK